MTAVLLPNGRQQFLTTAGVPAVGYKLMTWAAGTTTPQTTWADALKVSANANPIILDARGEAVIFWDGVYKIQLQDAAGAPVWAPVDNVSSLPSFSASLVPTVDNSFNLGSPAFSWANLYLGAGDAAAYDVPSGNIGYFKITAAETSAGLTVTNFSIPPYPINVLRYGIVPNSVSAAAANSAILQTLLNYNTTGPTGLLIFPNTTGADTYTFTGVCTMRPGLHIDLCGCTISVTGASTVNDVNTGFFYPLSDVIIENGSITTAVNTALGSGAAACIQVGARGTGFYYTVFDSTQSPSQGRIILRNLSLINSNTGGHSNHTLDLLGGLSNVLCENITINNNSIAALIGIYYEWGWATSPSGTATTQTSHGHNMVFKNLRILNTGGPAMRLTGAYNAIIDGLYTAGCAQCFVYTVGEAMFYLPWVSVDQAGAKRNITLRNIVGQNTSGTGLQLDGSSTGNPSYLHTAGVTFTPAQQTELMTFSIDGFAVNAMTVSGAITARNGKIDAAGAFLNPLVISDDCMYASFENVQILNGTGDGVRANVAGTGAWSPIRQKFLRFRGCLVAGNLTGFSLNNIRNANLSQNRIGFNALYDGQGNEATQTNGVNVNSGAQGVVCDSNYCTQAGGGVSYTITGTTSGGCNIINPLGTVTQSGAWESDGSAIDLAVNLVSAAATINTLNKYVGKRCMNSNTNKMFIAQGSAATGAGGGTWISTDGVTTITPV